MADELIDDNLSPCTEETYKKFDEDLKSYSNLTVIKGKIRLEPGQKNNIKAFIQCTRYQIRLKINTPLTRFPVVNASDYIKRNNHHAAYIKKSKMITETANPEIFMS